MEFLDEDTRPRFLFQSKPNTVSNPSTQSSNQLNKPVLFLTCSSSLLLICVSIFYIQTEPFKSLLLWLSLSLLLGPFAPSSITGGDIRVGQGPIVQFPIEEQQPQQPAGEEQQSKKKASQHRSRSKLYDDYGNGSARISNGYVKIEERSDLDAKRNDGSVKIIQEEEEREWSEEDVEILRKQMLKHPSGKPRRWEIISEVFNGRHRVESVIEKAKDLGNKKSSDTDSYTQFLKNRKPVDKRVEFEISKENVDSKGVEGVREESHWSNGDDIALLNALKTFPKDVSMRWEKIAAAVPGKTKAACMKRVAELKKDFRSAKASRED